MQPRKRQRTESYTSKDAPDFSMDREALDSLADNDNRICSRKLPEGSRSASQIPRENKILGFRASVPTHIDNRLCQKMQVPNGFNISEREIALLQRAMDRPPVTKQTLAELDLPCIMSNINLRVDVNFDHDLHFMPVKGKKGDQKRREARQYWAALALELRMYGFAARQSAATTRPSLQLGRLRLPQMFLDLKDLLLTLIPEVEAEMIEQVLDISLLMQQIERGVFDIAKSARWLAGLLKNHCAPMRDAWADEMVKMVEHGFQHDDTISIVSGLEKLFSILEAMKLVRTTQSPPRT